VPKEDRRLIRAREGKRETHNLDFKERFDLNSKADWCEVVKDLVAMANSGGGVIVFGVSNDATPAKIDLGPILGLDPAKVTDKVAAYTGEQLSGFQMVEIKRGRRRAAALLIDGLDVPVPFTRPGTYPDPDRPRKQKTAFSQGTLYVRHGAKSEPATRSDVTAIIERRLDIERQTLLRNVRRVVEAPADTEIIPIRRGVSDEQGNLTAIQLTTDPGAPVYGKLNPDLTHPYRQTELIQEVNKRLQRGKSVNTHDILSVRRAYDIDPARTPEFAHKPMYGSQQYSDAFVDWLVKQIKRDDGFLEDARQRYYDTTHGR
jgi:Schlafen, AlbA_2